MCKNRPVSIILVSFLRVYPTNMPPKKKQKRSHPWNDHYAVLYGLKVTSRDEKSGNVESAVCRFCQSFGREDNDDELIKANVAQKASSTEAQANIRKRCRTTNNKHFNKQFRTDNILRHLQQQHPEKYRKYKECLENKNEDPEAFNHFFSQSRIESFFEKCCKINGGKRTITVRKEIVEVIVREMLFDETDVLAGDRAMAAFTAVYEDEKNADTGALEQKVSCYTVSLNNQLQFDYVVSLIAAGLSFNQISAVIKENRDRLGTAAKSGCVSPGEASNFSRIVCALCLDVIGEIMNKTWSFSITADASTDDFGNSHLDTRVRFPSIAPGEPLLSFHLMAIPLFAESHSGESLFNHVVKVLDALCPDWRLRLIGSSTDGAGNMTGCSVGFTTRLAGEVEGMFYRVWCLAHQLDLVIKIAMNDIFDRGLFPFMSTLTGMVGWLRRQDTLIRKMKCKCPYVINVRWTSTSKVLKWLVANREQVTKHMQEKRFAAAPSETWWLVAMICLRYFDEVNITFKALQVDSSVVCKQYENLNKLVSALQAQCEASRDESRHIDDPDVASSQNVVSMGQFSVTVSGLNALCQGIDVEALSILRSLDTQQKAIALRSAAIVYLVSLNGIVRIMKGRQSTHRESEKIPGVLPLQVVKQSTMSFVHLVASHEKRLLASFDKPFVSRICEDHKALIRAVANEPALQARLEKDASKEFGKAWSGAGSRFEALQTFISGIATVMPTTSRVEGDFSLMNYRRDEHCAALTDYSLEGVMHAKQYQCILEAARSL